MRKNSLRHSYEVSFHLLLCHTLPKQLNYVLADKYKVFSSRTCFDVSLFSSIHFVVPLVIVWKELPQHFSVRESTGNLGSRKPQNKASQRKRCGAIFLLAHSATTQSSLSLQARSFVESPSINFTPPWIKGGKWSYTAVEDLSFMEINRVQTRKALRKNAFLRP